MVLGLFFLSGKAYSSCFEPSVEKHTVLQNENLSVVLARFHLHPLYGSKGSVEKAARINRLKNKNLVKSGQEIFLVQRCRSSLEQLAVPAEEPLPQVIVPAKLEEKKVLLGYNVHALIGSFNSRLNFESSYLDATVYSKNQILAVVGVKKFFEAKDFFYNIEFEVLKYAYETRAASGQKFVIRPFVGLGYQYKSFEFLDELSKQ